MLASVCRVPVPCRYIAGKMEPIEMGIEHFEMMKVLGKGTFGKVSCSPAHCSTLRQALL